MDDDDYDLDRLAQDLATHGTRLVYEREVASTMEIGAAQGVRSAVVLTDHQTAGRGRYSRTWDDAPGSSVLATFVKPVASEAAERAGTLLVSQLCVLAVHDTLEELAAAAAVKIRWPNDLTSGDRKLGGVLLMEGAHEAQRHSLLFGVGINVRAHGAGGYAATDLAVRGAVVARGELVYAIDARLDALLPDLARLGDPAVRRHYDARWQAASALLGRRVRISDGGRTIEGRVIGSPFGENLQLELRDGTIMEAKEYGHGARLEIIGDTE